MKHFSKGDLVRICSNKSKHNGETCVFLNYCKNGNSKVCSVWLGNTTVINIMEDSIITIDNSPQIHFYEKSNNNNIIVDWLTTQLAIKNNQHIIHTTQISAISTELLTKYKLFLHTADNVIHEIKLGQSFLNHKTINYTDNLYNLWLLERNHLQGES